MALAGGDAIMPADGKGIVGSANEFAWKPDLAGVDLLLSEAISGPTRIHQENTGHSYG